MEFAHQSPYIEQLFKKALENNDAGQLQLFFSADVLHRYREDDGYKIIRTDTSGRITRQGVWNLDFGISDKDRLIHVPFARFTSQVPESEREHWLEHLVTLPLSRNYIQGLVRPGCIDDGDIRNW